MPISSTAAIGAGIVSAVSISCAVVDAAGEGSTSSPPLQLATALEQQTLHLVKTGRRFQPAFLPYEDDSPEQLRRAQDLVDPLLRLRTQRVPRNVACTHTAIVNDQVPDSWRLAPTEVIGNHPGSTRIRELPAVAMPRPSGPHEQADENIFATRDGSIWDGWTSNSCQT